MIDAIGLSLYALCVDFMIRFANAFHMTYRDANASLFFLLWPTVTVALVVVRARQQRTIASLEAAVKDAAARVEAPRATPDRAP